METGEKDNLVDQLSKSYADIELILKGIDLEIPAHPDSDWRVRDILSHLASWDRQVTKSIRAFIQGSEYALGEFDETDFNQEAVLEQRQLTAQQAYEDWLDARQAFKDAVQTLSPDQRTSNFLYPWGDERGDIILLVRYMVEHDEEHKGEILKAIEASATA